MTAEQLIKQLIESQDQDVANIFAIAHVLKIKSETIEKITKDLEDFKKSTRGPKEFMSMLYKYIADKHYNDTEATFFGWMLCKYIGPCIEVPFGENAKKLFTEK